MIISFYSSKGGVGKTSSVLAFLSAVAAYNAAEQNPDEQISVLAVDSDEQGSLIKFHAERESRGLPSFGVTFTTTSNLSETAGIIENHAQNYDMVVIDFPGRYSDEYIRLALTSHVVLVPTNLELIEIQESTALYNHLQSTALAIGVASKIALLMVKIPPNANFLPVFSRYIIQTLRRQEYAILRPMLSLQQAVPNISNFGKYLFEQVIEAPNAKSPQRAVADANALFETVTLNWDTLPSLPPDLGESLDDHHEPDTQTS